MKIIDLKISNNDLSFVCIFFNVSIIYLNICNFNCDVCLFCSFIITFIFYPSNTENVLPKTKYGAFFCSSLMTIYLNFQKLKNSTYIKMYIFSFIPYREGVKIFNDIFPLEPKFFFFFYLDLCISKNLRKKTIFFFKNTPYGRGWGSERYNFYMFFFTPSLNSYTNIQVHYTCVLLSNP